MEYIKWLTVNDWALGIQLKRMDEIFRKYNEEKEYVTVNEVIELKLFILCVLKISDDIETAAYIEKISVN